MTIINHIRSRQPAGVGSLQFFGNDGGTGSFVDRVTILANETTHTANIGATDCTWDGWLNASASNEASGLTAGANYNAILGNIFLDRDRFNLTRSYVISLDGGRVTFGVNMATDRTLRATTDIRGAGWRHWVVTRDADTGVIRIGVNGNWEAEETGPTGDISCPNDAGGATYDPYLVLGTEKHDADLNLYPSYYGYMSCLRLSTGIRFAGATTYTIPQEPPVDDETTASLYLFNDGNGTLSDSAGNCNGTLLVGGSNNGPQWSASHPFS